MSEQQESVKDWYPICSGPPNLTKPINNTSVPAIFCTGPPDFSKPEERLKGILTYLDRNLEKEASDWLKTFGTTLRTQEERNEVLFTALKNNQETVVSTLLELNMFTQEQLDNIKSSIVL